MKPCLLISCALGVLLLAGCGDDGAKTDSAPGNPLTAPVDYIGAVTKAQQHAEMAAALASLRQTIQMFQMVEGRLPGELGELVTKGYLPQLPPAPAGQQIAYDPATGVVTITAKPASAGSVPPN